MPPTSSSPGRSRWFDSPFPEACSGLGGRLCRDRKPRFVHSLLLGSTEDATPEFRIEPMFPPALAIDNAPSSQDGPSINLLHRSPTFEFRFIPHIEIQADAPIIHSEERIGRIGVVTCRRITRFLSEPFDHEVRFREPGLNLHGAFQNEFRNCVSIALDRSDVPVAGDGETVFVPSEHAHHPSGHQGQNPNSTTGKEPWMLQRRMVFNPGQNHASKNRRNDNPGSNHYHYGLSIPKIVWMGRVHVTDEAARSFGLDLLLLVFLVGIDRPSVQRLNAQLFERDGYGPFFVPSFLVLQFIGKDGWLVIEFRCCCCQYVSLQNSWFGSWFELHAYEFCGFHRFSFI